MPESVTELSGKYVLNKGIELTWTSPTDATSLSQYVIYWYDLANAGWTIATIVRPVARSVAYSANKEFTETPTYYLFPWEVMLEIGAGNLPPTSISFKVCHKSADSEIDDGVTLNVYSPSIQSPVGVPHFKNDFSIDVYGQVRTNEQDTYAEVVDSVKVLMGTEPGQRPAVPLYGTEDIPLHMINPLMIRANIAAWEPRAAADVSVSYDDYNNAQLNISIENF